MRRTMVPYCSILLIALFANCAAQDQQASSVCTFEDGKQISVRYQPGPGSTAKIKEGAIWSPGGAPMLLFTSADLKVGNAEIPVGAYSMYVIPGKDKWTLVVSKNVSENGKYDQQQDLLRAPMGTGTLNSPVQPPSVDLGHTAAKQCNMRLYYQKTGAFIEFEEK